MNETPDTIDALPLQVRNRLEALLLQFDRSWTPDALSATINELPAGDATFRRVALLELLRIDLERHWQQGTRKMVDEYVSRVPDLGGPAGLPAELIAAEYEIRRQYGDAVDVASLARRFPEQAAEAERLIELARREGPTILRQRDGLDTSIRSDDTHSGSTKAGPQPAETPTVVPGKASASGAESPSPQSASGTADASSALSGMFGRYRIRKLLGQGAMGAIYLADDTVLQRNVALKTPRTGSDCPRELVDRFYREARAAATLQHHGICPVFDVDEINGQHYISMAFIDGRPLTDFIRPEDPVSLRAAALVVRQIARALAHAHANGVIHRDLKPANIMINERKEPLVMDFGLARLTGGHDESRATRDGDVLGTPAYMSPEQVRGIQDEIGPPTDIYSLGVILYELLCGQRPFHGQVAAVLNRILREEPPDLSTLRPDLDPRLQAICQRMMAKSQSERYGSMQDVADALFQWLKEDGRTGTTATGDDHGNAEAATPVAPQQTEAVVPAGEAAADFPPASPASPDRKRLSPTTRWLAAGGCAALVLAAVLLFVRPGTGILRIEVDDPQIAVQIKGTDIVLQQADHGRDLRLPPGQHTLIVQRGDFRFETDELTLKRGERITVRVDLLPDRIQAKQGDRILGQFLLPPAIASREDQLPQHTITPPPGLTPTDILLSEDWTWSEPVNLGPRVNGSQYDTYPSLTADGLEMYFMANRGEFGHNVDIMVARRPSVNEPFGSPELLGRTINTAVAELSPCISSDGLELFLARQRSDNPELKQLMVSRRRSTSEEFPPPEKIVWDENSQFGENYPAISPDHLTLVFHAKRPAHPDNYELYVTTRANRDAPFGPPSRIMELSSPGDEHFPRFAPDGDSLIFSSSRLPTTGEEDLWIARRRRADGSFEAPVRFDGGINTPGRDGAVAVSPDGLSAVYHCKQDDWNDLWMVRRVLKTEAAGQEPPEPTPHRPEYAEFATGKWIPLLRTQEELAEALTIDQEVTGPVRELAVIGPDGLRGVTLEERVLRIEHQKVFLGHLTARNMILRAIIKKVEGHVLSLQLRYPQVREVSAFAHIDATPTLLFGLGGNDRWNDETSTLEGWQRYVETCRPHSPDAFELAIARMDNFVWAYVDGRRVLETEVDPDLGKMIPGLGTYEGIAEFRDIEVQLLDDDIAERVKLP